MKYKLCLFILLFLICNMLHIHRVCAMSFAEANEILQDTFTIASYLNLHGEKDYNNQPKKVIQAALLGAYDAKRTFLLLHEKKQKRSKTSSVSPMFTINGQSLMSDQVVIIDEAPMLFAKLPEGYNVYVSRKAVELSALRYTGHAVKKHLVPDDTECFSKTILTNQGYFIAIEGLGDILKEAKLQHFTTKTNKQIILTGQIIDMNDAVDTPDAPCDFTLTLLPGDVQGTWKRIFTESLAQ